MLMNEKSEGGENSRTGLMMERWKALTDISPDVGTEVLAAPQPGPSQIEMAVQSKIGITEWRLGADKNPLECNLDSCGCGCA
jgi:hypothetical protein